jgi:SWI/SNF-related matrix-associated actin-dependent regulator of chromatin subfamily A-like protein 1
MSTKPLKFQRVGVDRLHAFNDRALLADDLGLGKTFQALLCAVESKAWPLVVVCPKSLKLHWKNQSKQHFGLKSTVLSGTRVFGSKLLRGKKIYILNYDILGPWLRFLKSLKPKMIVFDECQDIRTMGTAKCKNSMKLAKGVKKILGLSGTPLTNRPFELFPILHILLPDRFANPYAFGHKFCQGDRVFGRWKFSGARNMGTLNKILNKHCMVRRLKKEVMKDLPPMTWGVTPLEITDEKEYAHAENDFLGWLAKYDIARAARAARAERYTKFSYLKMLAAQLKMEFVLEEVNRILEESDEKILLGVIHKKTTQTLLERFAKWSVVIDGSKSEKQRQEAEDRFRKDSKVRILIGQIKAAGVGLNLPEAGVVGFVELPWTPGACQQFAARAHRMNSVNPVRVIYWVAAGTIEDKLCEIIQRKMRILDSVLDGVPVQDTSLTVFDELQKAMLKGKFHVPNPRK